MSPKQPPSNPSGSGENPEKPEKKEKPIPDNVRDKVMPEQYYKMIYYANPLLIQLVPKFRGLLDKLQRNTVNKVYNSFSRRRKVARTSYEQVVSIVKRNLATITADEDYVSKNEIDAALEEAEFLARVSAEYTKKWDDERTGGNVQFVDKL